MPSEQPREGTRGERWTIWVCPACGNGPIEQGKGGWACRCGAHHGTEGELRRIEVAPAQPEQPREGGARAECALCHGTHFYKQPMAAVHGQSVNTICPYCGPPTNDTDDPAQTEQGEGDERLWDSLEKANETIDQQEKALEAADNLIRIVDTEGRVEGYHEALAAYRAVRQGEDA